MDQIKNFLQEKIDSIPVKIQLCIVAVVVAFLAGGGMFFLLQTEKESNGLGALVNEEVNAIQAGVVQTGQEGQVSETSVKEVGKEGPSATSVWVDVKGAVRIPGVYECSNGQRVQDAIEKAGGVRKGADLRAVNLSQKLVDEMVVYIPRKGERVDSVEKGSGMSDFPLSSSTGIRTPQEGKIYLNQATAQELESLPGIGPKKAQSIIAFREQQGGFNSIEQLKEVDGIGEKTFEQLKPLVMP